MADYKLKKVIRNWEEYLFETWDIQWLLPITNPTINWVAEHWKNCLCWDDPDDDSCRWTPLTCWTCTSLVRKIWSDPTSITDWVVVTSNTCRDQYCSTYYVDTWLTNWCTYHYRTFANVSVWKPSCSSVLCLKPTKWFDVDFLLVAWGWGWWYWGWWYRSGWGWWAWWLIYCTKYQIWDIDTASITIWAGWWGGANWWNSVFCSTLFNIVSCWWWAWGSMCARWCSWGSWWWGGSSYYWDCYWWSWVAWQWNWWWTGWWDENSWGWGWASWGWWGGVNYQSWGWWWWCQLNISWTNTWYSWGWGWWAGCVYAWGDSRWRWANWWWNWWRWWWWWSATTYWSWWGWGSASSGWGSWCQWIFIMRYNKNCWYDISWWCKYECWDYCIHCFTSNWTLTFN